MSELLNAYTTAFNELNLNVLSFQTFEDKTTDELVRYFVILYSFIKYDHNIFNLPEEAKLRIAPYFNHVACVLAQTFSKKECIDRVTNEMSVFLTSIVPQLQR